VNMSDLPTLIQKRRRIYPENVCAKCAGTGTLVYGNTSTYWHSIGGAAMTQDVCEHCWGSGDASRPWPSHREFYEMKRRQPPTEDS
jgi:hypothetical protein